MAHIQTAVKVAKKIEGGLLVAHRASALAEMLDGAGTSIIAVTEKGKQTLALTPQQVREVKELIGSLDEPESRSRCRDFLTHVALMLGDARLLMGVMTDARHDQIRADALEICKQRLNLNMPAGSVVEDIFPAGTNKATEGVDTVSVEATWAQIESKQIGQA